MTLPCTAAPMCSGDPSLDRREGRYAHVSVLQGAAQLRSWPAALSAAAPGKEGFSISQRVIAVGHGPGDGGSARHCIKSEKGALWLELAGHPGQWLGPYRRLAGLGEAENHVYLSLVIAGCYASSLGPEWCFSRTGITVDGAAFKGSFSLATTDLPAHGTSLLAPGGPTPLLVLVPQPEGWAAYWDDYTHRPGRAQVVPGHTPPAFTLRSARPAVRP